MNSQTEQRRAQEKRQVGVVLEGKREIKDERRGGGEGKMEKRFEGEKTGRVDQVVVSSFVDLRIRTETDLRDVHKHLCAPSQFSIGTKSSISTATDH